MWRYVVMLCLPHSLAKTRAAFLAPRLKGSGRDVTLYKGQNYEDIDHSV